MPATANSGGRNKKSAAQHRAAGTFRPDRHGGVEVNLTEGEPLKPETLSEAASGEWDRVAGLMKDAGTLSPSDGEAIGNYVQVACLANRLQREVDELPSLQYPKLVAGGADVAPAVHPLVSQLVRARTAARMYLSELGLTPSSRDRVPRLTTNDLTRAEKRRKYFGRSDGDDDERFFGLR